jgi:Flp pilus assembly protein TadD
MMSDMGSIAMTLGFSKRRGLGALAVGLSLLAGCRQVEPRQAAAPPTMLAPESTPKLTSAQIADVKIAYARTLEKRGSADEARASYLEAIKLDPARADACARLGVLYDRQGKFDEADGWHRKAVAAQPKNPDFHCNLGYSLYVQGKLVEAEKSLRMCLAIAPDHARAHNNLGMVLARSERGEDALAEFRRAGCNALDAQTNLAFALTLEGRLPEARASYERNLAADPSSAVSQKGLQEVNHLIVTSEPATVTKQHGPNER